MNCFECAKTHNAIAAVGTCEHCGVGLCLDHLIEASEFRVGGTLFGCPHQIPASKPLRGVPAGVAASARHHTAVGSR